MKPHIILRRLLFFSYLREETASEMSGFLPQVREVELGPVIKVPNFDAYLNSLPF
jgi:hypothetical protein